MWKYSNWLCGNNVNIARGKTAIFGLAATAAAEYWQQQYIRLFVTSKFNVGSCNSEQNSSKGELLCRWKHCQRQKCGIWFGRHWEASTRLPLHSFATQTFFFQDVFIQITTYICSKWKMYCQNCKNNHAKSYRVNFLTALPDGREISPDPRDFPRANHMENLEGRVISVENGKINVSLCLCLSGHDFVCVSSSGICYKEGLVSTLAVSLSHRRPV